MGDGEVENQVKLAGNKTRRSEENQFGRAEEPSRSDTVFLS